MFSITAGVVDWPPVVQSASSSWTTFVSRRVTRGHLRLNLAFHFTPQNVKSLLSESPTLASLLIQFKGASSPPPEKLAKLRGSLTELLSAESCTFRSLAAVRGRLLHYAVCIMHVRPQVPAIQDGPESEAAYDVRRPITRALRDAAKQLLDVVDRQAARGAPMWPFVASSLYGAFLRGDTKAVIWDSSPFGDRKSTRLNSSHSSVSRMPSSA